jgi:hypothetical protein
MPRVGRARTIVRKVRFLTTASTSGMPKAKNPGQSIIAAAA